jgi:hypothetical protein
MQAGQLEFREQIQQAVLLRDGAGETFVTYFPDRASTSGCILSAIPSHQLLDSS